MNYQNLRENFNWHTGHLNVRIRRDTLARTLLAFAFPIFACFPLAAGQEQQPENEDDSVERKRVLGTVIVTAQKREENIQDVGISISALDGEQIEALGFKNAQQVTLLAPGVSTIQPNGESNYAIAMRGAANSDFTTNVESPVALYVDEVYISQSSGSGFMLFDTERVELLRGPQGTLYGRNATGGLVHFVTVKPQEEFGGYSKVSLGSYNTLSLEGAVNLPVSEQMAFRLSMSTKQGDGYITNRLKPNEKLNNSNDYASRLQVVWEPSETFNALINLRFGEQDIRTGFFEYVSAVRANGTPQPKTPNPLLNNYVDLDGDVYAGAYDFLGRNYLKTTGATVTARWQLGETELTSISDVQTTERDYIEDSDASPTNFFNFFLTTNAKQISQELRLAGGAEKLNWFVGVYYLDIGINDSNGTIAPGFLNKYFELIEEPSLIDVANGLRNPYEQDSQSISVFFQADYQINEQFKLTAGLRAIQEEKSFLYKNQLVTFPSTAVSGLSPNVEKLDDLVTPFESEQNDDLFSARIQLDYQPNDNFLGYISWNQGVRAGGFNAPTLPTAELASKDFLQYEPEVLSSFEIGLKWDTPDGRSRINASTYYYDYKDYQVFSFLGLDTFTLNAKAENYGFEAEFQTAPADGLDLFLGVGYISSTVTEVPGVTEDINLPGDNSISATLKETRPVQTPEWDIGFLVRYQFPVQNWDGNLAFQLNANYRSEHFFNLTQLPAAVEDGYTLSNAVVSWSPRNGTHEIRFAVNNLLAEEYLVQTFDLSGVLLDGLFGMIEQYYGRPRTFTASVRYEF